MESDNKGWVKLYRSIINWEWFNDAQMLKLYIYLMCSANIKPGKWRGITIKRGQVMTSYRYLAAVLGVGNATIDRMLSKLEDTGEISRELRKNGTKTEHKKNAPFLLITLNNYNEYQGSGTETEPNRNKNGTAAEQERNILKNNKNNLECKNERNIALPLAESHEPTTESGGWKSRRDF